MARNLMTNEEWRFFEHFIAAIRAPNGRKPVNHRLVLDGIFWIARTGAPWRDLPEEFGKWGSVYRQVRPWTQAGLWETMLLFLNDSDLVPARVQMIDNEAQAPLVRAQRRMVIRAHQQAAGSRGGLRRKVSAVLDCPAGKRSRGSFSDPPSTSRPRSTSG